MKSKQISKTAAYVAIKFYGLTLIKPYRELFDKEVITFYDRLVGGLPAPLNNYHSLLKKKWFRSACMNLDELLLPGDLMHILMRKLYIKPMIGRLIAKGYTQILILGAGFDHIGKTYSQSGVTCIELDTALMTHIKQHFLDQHGYSNNHLTVYPADLGEGSLSDILPEIPKLDPNAATVAVAEGFFDYLSPESFSQTLNELSEFFNNELKLVSTVFSLQKLNPFHAFVFRNAVRAVGERLELYASLDNFKDFLVKNNFKIDQDLTAYEMRDGITVPKDFEMAVLPGFYLLEASRNK